jgi:hypothetical protein
MAKDTHPRAEVNRSRNATTLPLPQPMLCSPGGIAAIMKHQLVRVTFLDILLIAALVAVPAWALVRGHNRGPAAAIVIHQNGRLVGTYPLDRDRRITVSCDQHDDVMLEVKSGRVRVAVSDCPLKRCIQEGWVGTPGRTIVCVPNRLVIEVTGGRSGFDVESY